MSHELWTQQPGSLAYPERARRANCFPDASQDEPWHPPLALWQLALLIVLTGGLYIIFWTWRFARDIKRHVDPRVKSWLHVVGVIVPFGILVVLYAHYDRIRTLSRFKDQQPLVGATPFWACVWLLLVGGDIAYYLLTEDLPYFWEFLWFIPSSALFACPWLALQINLNRFKQRLSGATWSSVPYRFTRLQYVALVIGLLLHVFIGWACYVIELPDGRIVYPRYPFKNDIVYGPGRLYQLTIPASGWAVLPGGSYEPDSDIELLRQKENDIYAIVYRYDDPDITTNEFLTAAQDDLTKELEDPKVTKSTRQVDPATDCDFLHISSIGPGSFDEAYIEVGACQTLDGFMSIVAFSKDILNENSEIRALVQSFRTVPPE